MIVIYFFAAAWKWAPEWHDDASAVYLALSVNSFTTRFGYLLLQMPEVLRWMTRGTMWLETLGPVLLLLPFNVGLQRLVAVGLFVMFHMGLALTMELGTFPWVCMVAWLPLLPGGLWDRLAAALRPAGDGLTLAFAPQRAWAKNATYALRMWLFLWDTKHEPAGPDLAQRLAPCGGWCVLAAGQELTGREALARLVGASPVWYPLASLFRTRLGSAAAWLVGGRPGARAEPARPAWSPPGGPVVTAVVLGLLVYVVLMNVRTFGYSVDQAFPDPNRPPQRWQAVLPNQNLAFGAALGIDQGWGLFAPRPGKYTGWWHVVGVQEDGRRVDLLQGGREIDDLDWKKCRPDLPAAVFANNRWRKMIQNLSAFDVSRGAGAPGSHYYPYLLPGLAQYTFREWNARHHGEEMLRAVEIIWWKEETRPPGVEVPPPERIRLLRFEPCEVPRRRYRYFTPDNPPD